MLEAWQKNPTAVTLAAVERMTVELLIQAIVRQTTILIAQLATAGGTRAPLAHVANQVFLDLVHELERQGVSRKVSADMFGLGLRTYQRKIQRFTESSTDKGRSLWVAVLDHVAARGSLTRNEVLGHFSGDDDAQVRAVLHDLCESGLITASGAGAGVAYRVTPEEELARLRQTKQNEGLDELLWALIYREGPLGPDDLASQAIDRPALEAALARLEASGHVERADGLYRASTLLVPLGAPVGWEAAVFDHYRALVNTVGARLGLDRASASLADRIGGSTYTLDVWPGHPHAEEAEGTLGELRQRVSKLRQKIEEYNAGHERPDVSTEVVVYLGQCLIQEGGDEHGE